MQKLFKVLLLVVLGALLTTAGYEVMSQHYRQNHNLLISLNALGDFLGTAEADAHAGGECYLDDGKLQSVENGCYAKCSRGYSESAKRSACEVGCSYAIDVATKK
jgi:hypothetical protein